MIGTTFRAGNSSWASGLLQNSPFHGMNMGMGMQNSLTNRPQNNLFGQNTAATSPAFRNAVTQLGNTANTLVQNLNNLQGLGRNGTSPFDLTRPVAENSDVLNIRSFDENRLRNANLSNLSIEVSQIATVQQNEGDALSASRNAMAAGFTLGSNRIAITVDNRRFEVSFNVAAGDTTRDVQQRIAAAINSRNDIAVSASVSQNTTAGTSSLVLSSSQTGIANEGQPNFTVSDVIGNSVAITGVTDITQEAQNAEFRITRGAQTGFHTSRSNDVDLGHGITARLTDTGTTGITMGSDTTAQVNAFRNMVNSFNGLMRTAREFGRSSNLERDLSSITQAFRTSLSRMGVTLNPNGTMSIDESRLQQAAEEGELQRFGTRTGTNFFSRLTRTAESVSRNPATFADSRNSATSMFDANSRFLSLPTQMSRNMRTSNAGMFFNTLR